MEVLHAPQRNTLQHSLQHTATHCYFNATEYNRVQQTATHTATHCNILQHPATRCNTLQHAAASCNTLQQAATICNMLQHAATHCNTLPSQERGNRALIPTPPYNQNKNNNQTKKSGNNDYQ